MELVEFVPKYSSTRHLISKATIFLGLQGITRLDALKQRYQLLLLENNIAGHLQGVLHGVPDVQVEAGVRNGETGLGDVEVAGG